MVYYFKTAQAVGRSRAASAYTTSGGLNVATAYGQLGDYGITYGRDV